jgi:hypothetical protein
MLIVRLLGGVISEQTRDWSIAAKIQRRRLRNRCTRVTSARGRDVFPLRPATPHRFHRRNTMLHNARLAIGARLKQRPRG